MKITYTGRQVELAPAQLKKIETQFAKVGKLLDGREEKEAHVILSLERHLHQAEITVNYYNHQLVGIGSNVDRSEERRVGKEWRSRRSPYQLKKKSKGISLSCSVPNGRTCDYFGYIRGRAD